jgi:hypothetical protein
MKISHVIQDISFDKYHLLLVIDGNEIKIPLAKVSKKLEVATDIERQFYKISPSGYGIHWPLIDEDLSVNALLKLV